ncbi:hypothetical protein EGLA_13450 [Enterococcus gallinarum]|nr:hypothetical protein AH4_08380 [Enterococcus gallinarum]
MIDCHFFFWDDKKFVFLIIVPGKNAFDKRNAHGLPAEFFAIGKTVENRIVDLTKQA